MTAATCPSCGGEFEQRAEWQRLCWECWRQRKDDQLNVPDEAALARGMGCVGALVAEAKTAERWSDFKQPSDAPTTLEEAPGR